MYILLLSLLVFSVLNNNNNRRRAASTRAKNNPLLPDIDIDFERFVYQHTASMLANSNNDINEQEQTQIEEDDDEEDTEEDDTEENYEEEEDHLPPISGPPLVRKSNCQIIYVLGVEGSIHASFRPILQTLADLSILYRRYCIWGYGI